MRNRIIIAYIMWVSVFAAVLMAGCSPEQVAVRSPAEFQHGKGIVLSDAYRLRRDETRNQVWLLGVDGVRVYDSATQRLIKAIDLPNWSVARFTCDPDMVLDSSGSAIVSSNAQSRLWRIDAVSFNVNEHEIRLQGREQWDAGFGALAFGADGTLLALMSFGGSLWTIDLGSGTASRIAPDKTFFNACGSTLQYRRGAEAGVDGFAHLARRRDQ